MKTDIHPDYVECRVTCSCGNQFVTRATVPELRVELCAACHPFYTGKQKLVDTGGRVERFEKRYARSRKQEAAAGTGDVPEEADDAEDAEGGRGKKVRRKKRAAAPPRVKPPVATKGGPRPKIEPGTKGGRRDGPRRGDSRRDDDADRPAEAPAGGDAPEASDSGGGSAGAAGSDTGSEEREES